MRKRYPADLQRWLRASCGWVRTIAALITLAGLSARFASAAGPPSFQGLGDLPGGIFKSGAYGVSGDGLTAVGDSVATPNFRAFRWTSSTDRTSAAPYVVRHAGGLTGTIKRNQRVNGGTWQALGTWTFKAGTTGYVRLSNAGTTGKVIADAVRFVKQ